MEKSNGSILVKVIRSLQWGIVLVFCLVVFVAGAGKLMEWMLRQSAGTAREKEKPDIEEEFEQQAEGIRQWAAREKGLAEEALEVQCQGLEASFSYRGETLVMTGYPMESGIKVTGHLLEEEEDSAGDPAMNAVRNAAEGAAGDTGAGTAAVNPLLEPNGLWDYGRLWEYCGDILGESDGKGWHHDTYPLLADPGEQAVVLLYRTSGGEDGCLYLTDTIVLRLVMGKEEREAGRLEEAKAYLEAVANMQKYVKGIEPPEKVAARWDSLWTGAFRKLCAGKVPYEDIGWADEKVREAIVWQIKGTQRHALVSREEVMGVEALRISGAEEVGSFRDFRYIPDLHSLSVSYREPGEAEISGFLGQLPLLPDLTVLEIRNAGLQDLSFAENMAGLEELVLDGGEIRDISPLAGCTELRRLQLTGGKISDVASLAGLHKLEYLVLDGNEVENLEGLGTLENLVYLDVSHNQVEDLSPLAGLGQLEELYAGDNRIMDITPLKEMNKLRCLSLSGNRIEDISVLAQMKGMVYLWTEDNRIEDYTALEELDRLYYLSISHGSGQDVGNLAMVPYLVLAPQAQIPEAGSGEELAQAGAEKAAAKKENPGMGSVPGTGAAAEEENPGMETSGSVNGNPGMEESSGNGFAAEGKADPAELSLAQRWLNMVYPEWDLEARDIVKGDMNGDGINDMAIIGIFPEEKWEDGSIASGTWYIYTIMSSGGINSGLTLVEPVPLGGSPERGGELGYLGAALSNGRLMVQYGEYGGGNPVRKTDIYEYDGRRMVEKQRQTLQFGCFLEDAVWRVEDLESGEIQLYSISDGERGEKDS